MVCPARSTIIFLIEEVAVTSLLVNSHHGIGAPASEIIHRDLVNFCYNVVLCSKNEHRRLNFRYILVTGEFAEPLGCARKTQGSCPSHTLYFVEVLCLLYSLVKVLWLLNLLTDAALLADSLELLEDVLIELSEQRLTNVIHSLRHVEGARD